MKAALSLTDKKYVAKPLRRVYIEKPGSKKKRPLGIPTMYDSRFKDPLNFSNFLGRIVMH
jgi:retron-type reverse transcriptase